MKQLSVMASSSVRRSAADFIQFIRQLALISKVGCSNENPAAVTSNEKPSARRCSIDPPRELENAG